MSHSGQEEKPEENDILGQSAAPGAAVDAAIPHVDPDLVAIAEAWPTLPEVVRAGILAMVKTAAVKGA
jgi:hypothetical protein